MSQKSKRYNSADGYDLYAPKYDGDIPYLNSFEDDVVFKFLGNLWGKEVLDLGCGTGRLIGHLKNLGGFVSGVDLSEGMLDRAKDRYPDVAFELGNSEDLPYADESFDVVVCTFLIVHLRELRQTFDEVHKVLKPGGRFIVTNINQRKAPKLDGGIVIDSFYHRPDNVIEALERSFFKVEKEEFVYEDKTWVNQVIRAVKL